MSQETIYEVNEQDFFNWIADTVNDLFHVSKTDIDKEYGIRLDRRIVFERIREYPEVLEFRSFKELFEMFDILN